MRHNQTDYVFHVSHMPVFSVNKGGEHERVLQLSVSLFLFLYHNKKCFSRALDTGQSTVISGAPQLSIPFCHYSFRKHVSTKTDPLKNQVSAVGF